MTFHFPTPRRLSRKPRRNRVVDEYGWPVEQPSKLEPAVTLHTRRAAPTDPAMLPAAQCELVVDTPLVARAPQTWEERMAEFAALWGTVEERLSKLAGYVSGKSTFDAGEVHKWSEHLRTRRVRGDRTTDGHLLEDASTREMAGLRNAISARILADALAATP